MKWEYKIIKADIGSGKFNHHKLEQLMNELGQQGWELVIGFRRSALKDSPGMKNNKRRESNRLARHR